MRVRNTTVEAVVGDLTIMDTEAIVNAANSQLWMGGGVAGAIKRAAGDEVEREAMAQGPIRPGEAVATRGGRLRAPIRWVIHAATMGPDLVTSDQLVRAATASALAKAEEIGARSIALPALGTGVGGLATNRAAEMMVGEALGVAQAGSGLERIVFVLRNADARHAFAAAMQQSRWSRRWKLARRAGFAP